MAPAADAACDDDFVRRLSRIDLALVIIAVVAAGATIYLGLRYGDVHRFGDSEYRRLATSDRIAILVPAIVMGTSLTLLALRRLAGGSITAQWHRELELLAGVAREKELIRPGSVHSPWSTTGPASSLGQLSDCVTDQL